MLAIVAAWMTAAKVAVETAVPTALVTIGTHDQWDDTLGRDLVIVGADDTATGDREPAFTFDGEWHDSGAAAVTRGQVRVPITLYSASASSDLDVPGRVAAATTLHTAVRGALIPSPAGSALGVDGLMWTQETAVQGHIIHAATGPIVALVLTFTLETLA